MQDQVRVQLIAAEERERLRLAYVLMTRVFVHVSHEKRQTAMDAIRYMHDKISGNYGWPPLDPGRGD